MKRLVSALSLFLLFTIASSAQSNNSAASDSAAVQATVKNYIEAYYTGDQHRMEQTLHPHYLKHKIHGDIPMREMNARDLLGGVNSGPSLPEAGKKEEITVLDVANDMASAKLVTPGWVDYVTLVKSRGEWKILSVVQNIRD